MPEKKTSHICLTLQEEHCLSKAAEGKTNKEIATELFITENTVKSHLQGSYRKLGASNKVHAVALAMKKNHIQLN